jgi:hypothetical protein
MGKGGAVVTDMEHASLVSVEDDSRRKKKEGAKRYGLGRRCGLGLEEEGAAGLAGGREEMGQRKVEAQGRGYGFY